MIVLKPANFLHVLILLLFFLRPVQAATIRTIKLDPSSPAGDGTPLACAVSPDGKLIAVGLSSRAAVVFDENKLIATNGHAGAVNAVAFSPDGDRLLTGSEDFTACVWTNGIPKAETVLKGHFGSVRAVAFSPDGRQVLTASDDSTARLWDARTGKLANQLGRHTGPVRAAVFSPDGKKIVTGSDDRTIRVWDADSGRLVRTMMVEEPVSSLAISPDGRRVVVGMKLDQPQIWDLEQGRLLNTLYGHAASVLCVQWATDGRSIVSAAQDRSVIVWDAVTAQEGYRRVEDGSADQAFYVSGSNRIALLNKARATVSIIDLSGELPRRLHTRGDKILLLVGVGLAWMAAVLGVLVVLAVTVRRNRKRKQPVIMMMVLVTALTLVLVVPVIEVGLRVILNANYKGDLKSLPPVPAPDFKREIEFLEIVNLDPNPKIGYTFRPNIKALFGGCRVVNNSMGYRDDPVKIPKPPRTIRVVGVGDSTMWGYGIRKEEDYLELLEAEFNDALGPDWKTEFVNTGVVGYNTTQEAEAFVANGIKLDPDAVIIQFDLNDLQSILSCPKPDFLFSRTPMMAHLPEIFRGEASDPRAFYLLYQKDLLTNPAYPYTGWSAVEQGYRRVARACQERNIPVYGLLICEDTPKFGDPLNPLHARVLDLWGRIGITPIQALPRVQDYMRENGQNWLKITLNQGDVHPNRVGHALIAQAVMPYMREFLMKKAGVIARKPDKDRLGNLLLRQISQSGLHQNEMWGDALVNWTGPSASFQFVPAGGKLIVPIHIGHPDVSAGNPVKVSVTIEGSPRRETQRTFTHKGHATIEVDLHDLHAGPLQMTITVNRTFSTPSDPRHLGVAVHNLRFE